MANINKGLNLVSFFLKNFKKISAKLLFTAQEKQNIEICKQGYQFVGNDQLNGS